MSCCYAVNRDTGCWEKLSQRGNTKSVNNVVVVFEIATFVVVFENTTGCVFVYLKMLIWLLAFVV